MKIGIVGVSGYGGSELLRLCAGHPAFEIAYVGGESTVGQALAHDLLRGVRRRTRGECEGGGKRQQRVHGGMDRRARCRFPILGPRAVA